MSYGQPTALIPPEAFPHKRRFECDTNISPRRLIHIYYIKWYIIVQLYAVMVSEAPLSRGQQLQPKQECEARRGHQSLAPYGVSYG